MWSKGYAAEETKAAFARVGELATEIGNAEAPLDAYFGRWVQSLWRGEFGSAREAAESFLREAEREMRLTEAGVAHRMLGLTLLCQGDFEQARAHLEQALKIYDPVRDRETQFRLGSDPRVLATSYLAFTAWCFGDVTRARELIDEARARAVESTHAPALANTYLFAAMLEIHRNDAEAARRAAETSVAISREHGLALYVAGGALPFAWACAKLGDWYAGSAEFRQALADYASKGNRLFLPFYRGLLAEIEAEGADAEAALAEINGALALAVETGEHWFDAGLHRIRGEILVKQNSADPDPAEAAFLAAVAVAKRQGARSFGLRAALSLAKLYQSTARPVEAHAVLAPALEGFALTPEMPEIAEAQTLLAALEKNERVREALEKRQARAKMHLDYARAVQWAKGWGAEEARAAVERAHEFAAPTPGHPDYWSLTYGRFAVSLLRGEFRAALEIAETYLRQAQVEGRPDHAVNARRLLGTVKLELGAFFESRQEFEKLLEDWDEDRDKGLRAVTGADVLCVGWAYMAQLMMILGEVDDAVRMSEGAIRRAESLGDFGSLAFAMGLGLFVLAMCGRSEDTLRRAEAFEANASEKGARLWESIAREWASWARGLITGDAAGAATELRDIMAARRERQERQSAYTGHGVLAQFQGKAGAIDDALASIAEGLALAEQTGGHRADSFLHRVRGDVLAERDRAAAEASYREALRIAESQGARMFELQAAHALGKLLGAAGRPVEAHAVLAPALEGFSPTPEMPEIAAARALLVALGTNEPEAADLRR
jgi:predicted ATPase